MMESSSNQKKCVVLLSGGLDSATTLLLAQREGFLVYAISFRYGQRHLCELSSAEAIVRKYQPEKHLIMDVSMDKIAGSSLTDYSCDVPKERDTEKIEEIPSTYVPARNTIFLSIALGWSEVLGASDIFIGANAIDYSGYPDCRPEYLKAFEKMANLATCSGTLGNKVKIQAPLIKLSKAEIIKQGNELGLDFTLTHSCYDPNSKGKACGKCDSCILRQKGFLDAGIEDPTAYYTV